MNPHVNHWIENNYGELQSIVKNITRNDQLGDDLLQEVMVQLYEKDDIVLQNYDDDSIKFYIIKVIKINWISKTSPFHYKVRKETSNYSELKPEHTKCVTTEQEEYQTYEDLLSAVEVEFSELNWFSKKLFELYLTLGSLKKVSNQTGIPIASTGRYIREIKQEIRTNIEKRKNGEI